MNPSLRACIANLAARLAGQTVNSTVYDHTQAKHIRISGNASAESVNLHEHDRDSYLTGPPSSLYDHVQRAHLSLVVQGTKLSGYDHGSRYHYSGDINGHSVIIFDHQSKTHHHYDV
ncbi:MAG: hypothetical protein H6975_07640 [Gammaproteobacteria bacterium]|nr:hypothetical protein [Gammaproteobacteria bacterium]